MSDTIQPLRKPEVDALPCPFCGFPAMERQRSGYYEVGCFNPKCRMHPRAGSTDGHTHIARWNTQAEGSSHD